MAENSKIQWTDHTFNPWRGCQKVSPGCKHCYAENRAGRFGEDFAKRRIVLSESGWKQPLVWNRKAEREGVRKRVFCASLADVFEDWEGPMHDHNGTVLDALHWAERQGEDDSCVELVRLPVEMHTVRHRLFELIDSTPWLNWLLLTKRPENIRRMWFASIHNDCDGFLNNVWLLTSVENQDQADKRIPELLKCRNLVPVLGLSMEPLLGPVDLTWIYGGGVGISAFSRPDEGQFRGIDWVIVGGESGPKARRFNVEWAHNLMHQCRKENVAVFLKQFGRRPYLDYYTENDELRDWAMDRGTVMQPVTGGYTKWDHTTFGQPHTNAIIDIKLKDKKGGDWDEWPECLRVRELPSMQMEAAQ